MVVDVPSHREQVVVLPEVVGRMLPECAVAHLITLGEVVAVSICGKAAVRVIRV